MQAIDMQAAGHRRDWNELSDEQLMVLYSGGDEDAFQELFRRHEPRAYAFFVKRTASRERAEDLYQELFLRIHRARHSYDATRPFLPWMFQIARRLWIDEVRRVFRNREVALEGGDAKSGYPTAERVLVDREELDEALAALTPQEQSIVVAFKVQGRDYSELAQHFGKSVGAIKKAASRALLRVGALPHARMQRDAKR
jgi:RNA polymerase sigma-70 factor (ECF subfamily)